MSKKPAKSTKSKTQPTVSKDVPRTGRSASKSKQKESKAKAVKTTKKLEKEVVVLARPVQQKEVYEDDFEDYVSDFEDDVSEVQSHPLRAHSPSTLSSGSEPRTYEEVVNGASGSLLLSRINQAKLVDVGSREDVTTLSRNGNARPTTSASRVFTFENKTTPNAETLLRLVDMFAEMKANGHLSFQFIQSVDIAPNRVLELYNNLVENSTTSRRFTQTGEDHLESGVQTTLHESIDKTSQFPIVFVTKDTAAEVRPQRNVNAPFTAERFLRFVGITGRTFSSLLGQAKTSESVHLPLRPNVEFSAGFVQFSLEHIAQKCRSIAVELGQPSTVLVGFYVQECKDKVFLNKSLLLEYSFDDLEQPKSAYLTDDEITDFSYSSDGRTLIFAGQKSGNCLLWDLVNKNVETNSENLLRLSDTLKCQLPSYSTAYMSVVRRRRAFRFQPDQCVVQTKALKRNESSNQQQFLSVNAGAVATVWAVARHGSANAINDDLGLSFNSLVRLMQISNNMCVTALGFGSAPQIALCADASNRASVEFAIGTSRGAVVRVCRGGEDKQQLRVYSLSSGTTSERTQTAINSICFCPHDPDYFVVGCLHIDPNRYFEVGAFSGSLLIFKTTSLEPVAELKLKENRGYRVEQVSNVVWSHSHAQTLYTLYDCKYFAVWDLSTLHVEPEIIDLSQKFGSIITRLECWSAMNDTFYIGFTLISDLVLIHELHRSFAPSLSLRQLFGDD